MRRLWPLLLVSLAFGCEGFSYVSVPVGPVLDPVSRTFTRSASAETITVVSTGQAVMVDQVGPSVSSSGEMSAGYTTLRLLPGALSNVHVTRSDTEFGADETFDAEASETKTGLFSHIGDLIGAAIGGAAGASAGPAGAAAGAVTGAAVGDAVTD